MLFSRVVQSIRALLRDWPGAWYNELVPFAWAPPHENGMVYKHAMVLRDIYAVMMRPGRCVSLLYVAELLCVLKGCVRDDAASPPLLCLNHLSVAVCCATTFALLTVATCIMCARSVLATPSIVPDVPDVPTDIAATVSVPDTLIPWSGALDCAVLHAEYGSRRCCQFVVDPMASDVSSCMWDGTTEFTPSAPLHVHGEVSCLRPRYATVDIDWVPPRQTHGLPVRKYVCRLHACTKVEEQLHHPCVVLSLLLMHDVCACVRRHRYIVRVVCLPEPGTEHAIAAKHLRVACVKVVKCDAAMAEASSAAAPVAAQLRVLCRTRGLWGWGAVVSAETQAGRSPWSVLTFVEEQS